MPTWTIRSRISRHEWQGRLFAYWEVHYDPVSDPYTFADAGALDLLGIWADVVRKEHPNGLVPILWLLTSRPVFKPEFLPFQYNHTPDLSWEDFLTFYEWPLNARTGERLNWNTLPVASKLWNATRQDKGGFIQQATGWKPAIYQPFVYLPALLDAAGLG